MTRLVLEFAAALGIFAAGVAFLYIGYGVGL